MEEVIELFRKIQSTSGLNEKQRILRENKDNELFKKCLVFLLDGNIVTGISTTKMGKMTISKAENYSTFDLKSFSDVIDYLKDHNTGTDIDVATVRKFICNNSKSDVECEFYEQMVTKKYRLGADSKLVNKAIPGLIEEFNVQLGTSIEKVKLKGNELIYISRKLNGLRCAYIGTECRTRQNKKINGVDHIIKDLQAMGYENMFVDGELLYKNKEGLSDSEAFQKGTGIANSKNGDKSQLKFVVFDMFPLKEFWSGKSKEPYSIRSKDLDDLEEKLKFHPTDNIEVVSRVYHGYDHSKIWEWLQYAEDNDWEGCCLNLDAPYECKRTKNLIKVKQFYDATLRVIGYEEGSGKNKGALGSLIVKYKDGKSGVGYGYSDQMRKDLWPKRDELIGKLIDIKYKEETRDKNTGLPSLQFAGFICFREDYDKVLADDEAGLI